jgi:adenylosuccinate synthase
VQLAIKNPMLQAFGMPALDLDTLLAEKLAQYARVQEYLCEPFGLLQAALEKNQAVLLEGAQGALLDNDWGTYPFCTASTTLAGGAAAGAGIAARWLKRVVGVAKAYTTRVGAGPLPTELLDDTGEALRQAGQEFGTVTGRPRRCGWFDAELVRFTARLNGVSELALTKLDVLDGLPVVKIGVGYRTPGEADQLRHYWEGDAAWLERCHPEYIELPGWQEPTARVRRFSDLPDAAQDYVRKIAELTATPVSLVSVGPGRDETFPVPD